MTPLMLATKKRSEQMINVLIHTGVDINAKSNDVSLKYYYRSVVTLLSNCAERAVDSSDVCC